MKIKVCGITKKKDALALDLLQINYLGFIFYPKSKRYIKPVKVKEIVSSLKFAKSVGVFVNESPQEINRIVKFTGLDFVQLHGHETEQEIQQIQVPVIKVIHVSDDQIKKTHYSSSKFLLFDSQTKNSLGGTGTSFDFKILKNLETKQPFFIAGGLGPHNLHNVIEECPNTYAIDLNSKVEISPGIKDLNKIKNCLSLMKN